MKTSIHPKLQEIEIVLSDGSKVLVRTNKKFISDVDSRNHPVYVKLRSNASEEVYVDKASQKFNKKVANFDVSKLTKKS